MIRIRISKMSERKAADKKRKYGIVVVTHEPFPSGMAATNRMISYLKPVSARDIPVKVLILKPTEKADRLVNTEAKGSFGGIDFEYVNKSTLWPGKGNKIKKFYLVTTAYFQTIRKLVQIKPGTVITYTGDLIAKLILFSLRPVLKYKIIIEETEYPKVLRRKKPGLTGKWQLRLYKKADGMLVMTKELENYYRGLGVDNLFHLPMTVDFSRFEDQGSVKKGKFFAYVGGSGGFIRDGVLDIIRAFEIFVRSNPGYQLLIVGPADPESPATKEIMKYIQEHNAGDNVILSGPKATNEIPELLARATGIVMAPPKNFSSGGFPTKLGEFLASGTPTICTRVSDIADYLDETNSYLVAPGDIPGIFNAMNEIITNRSTAEIRGKNGRALASAVFNAETYLPSLIDFIYNYSNGR